MTLKEKDSTYNSLQTTNSLDDRLSVHCLRKSYGTNVANLGTPVHTLKELMGHSNIQTTMEFYLKSTDANKLKAVERLEGMVG